MFGGLIWKVNLPGPWNIILEEFIKQITKLLYGGNFSWWCITYYADELVLFGVTSVRA